jgi:chromate transporter
LNLAVFFAQHTFLPNGLDGASDFMSIVISAGALLALVRYKIGVIPVIAVCGLLGVGWKLFI